MTTPADLFKQALTIDDDDDVSAINLPLARQAMELHRAMGEEVRTLLQPHLWYCFPRCVLSLAFDGAEHGREMWLHAAWCVERAVMRITDMDEREDYRSAIAVVREFAYSIAGKGEYSPEAVATLMAEKYRIDGRKDTGFCHELVIELLDWHDSHTITYQCEGARYITDPATGDAIESQAECDAQQDRLLMVVTTKLRQS